MNFPDLQERSPFLHRFKGRIAWIFDVAPGAKLLLFATFFLFFGESIFYAILNLYLVSDLGLSYAWVTIFFATTMFAGALVSLPIGFLCIRVGRKFVLQFGFYCWIIGLFGMAAFQQIPLLFFFAAVHGIGLASVWTAFSPMIVELTPPEQHVKAFTANFAMVFMGSFAGYVLGGLLPILIPYLIDSDVSPYRLTLFVGAFAVFPAYRFFNRIPVQQVPKSTFRITRPGKIERKKRLITNIEILLPYSLCGIAVGLVAPFINIFLRSTFAVKDQNIGFLLGAVCAIEGVLIVLIPFFANKTGRINLTSASLLLSAPLLILVGVVEIPSLSILLLILSVAIMQMSLPLQQSFAMRQYPSHLRGMISAEMATVWYCANGIGAVLSLSVASNEMSLLGKNYISAAIFVVLAGVSYWLFWRKMNNLPGMRKMESREHLAFSHGSSGRVLPVKPENIYEMKKQD